MNKSKKAISEVISYVLLIVIALSLAGGIWAWMKFMVPSDKTEEKCADEVAVFLSDYSCNEYNDLGKIISLTIDNKGLFNVDGFFILAGNDSTKMASVVINSTDFDPPLSGRYEFPEEDPFTPGETVVANFSVNNIPDIKKVQIQPYIVSKRTNTIIPCTGVVSYRIENCVF